ncbi:MAG: ankyrin repeat domain-containing protein [Desulfobacterales bacterium]|nr:ankyrin repeat domain-containing protein [Desulfobacterales bacterium]
MFFNRISMVVIVSIVLVLPACGESEKGDMLPMEAAPIAEDSQNVIILTPEQVLTEKYKSPDAAVFGTTDPIFNQRESMPDIEIIYPEDIRPSLELSLFQAIGNRDSQHVHELLESGADPNKKPSETGVLPLEAAETAEIVLLLLDYDADPNLKNDYGKAAIHHAIFQPEAEGIIKVLINHGADVNMIAEKGGKETPLHMAAQLYIESDDRTKAERIIRQLINAGADVDSMDKYGYTVLMMAVVNDRPQLVRLMLDLGADAQLKNKEGMTAPAYGQSLKISPEIISMLDGSGDVK